MYLFSKVEIISLIFNANSREKEFEDFINLFLIFFILYFNIKYSSLKKQKIL